MKKILVALVVILLTTSSYVYKNGNELLLAAQTYGVEYSTGTIFGVKERIDVKDLIEEADINNHNLATDMINEMVEKGYDENKIPLVLYSGVTTAELDLITQMYDEFIKTLPKEETIVEEEVEETEEVTEDEVIDDDSDDDGVSDEYDICDGGNDLIDDNYNLVPDECESIDYGESAPIDTTDEGTDNSSGSDIDNGIDGGDIDSGGDTGDGGDTGNGGDTSGGDTNGGDTGGGDTDGGDTDGGDPGDSGDTGEGEEPPVGIAPFE